LSYKKIKNKAKHQISDISFIVFSYNKQNNTEQIFSATLIESPQYLERLILGGYGHLEVASIKLARKP